MLHPKDCFIILYSCSISRVNKTRLYKYKYKAVTYAGQEPITPGDGVHVIPKYTKSQLAFLHLEGTKWRYTKNNCHPRPHLTTHKKLSGFGDENGVYNPNKARTHASYMLGSTTRRST